MWHQVHYLWSLILVNKFFSIPVRKEDHEHLHSHEVDNKTLHLMELEKEEQTEPKVSGRKETI